MKKKLLYFILVISTLLIGALTLTACGEQVDTTLYHLKLSYSSNVDFSQDDLVATFAYGERHDITERPQDEIDSYLSAGATQENIDKTIVRQQDGSYYFFSEDPIIISAPEGEDAKGYRLVGFFDKSTNECVYKHVLGQCQLGDGSTVMLMQRWNMPDRDVELEARYESVNYTVNYCYGLERGSGASTYSGIMPAGTHTNPTEYDFDTLGDVALTAPTQTIEGYEFKYWYYTKDGSAEKIKCETLPQIIDEDYIHVYSYDANGNPEYGIYLFAYYDVPSFEVTFIVDFGVSLTVCKYGESTPLDISAPITVEYGTVLDVWVDDSEIYVYYPEEDHEFEGIFVNDVKVEDIDLGGGSTRPCNRTNVTITGTTLIEIRVMLVTK